MKLLIMRVAIGLVTFLLGVSTVSFWTVRRQSHAVAVAGPQAVPSVDVPYNEIDRRWVYIPRDLKWRNAPKQLEFPVQAVDQVRLVVFRPTGEFASVSVGLERSSESAKLLSKSAPMWMTPGDGYSVSKARGYSIRMERSRRLHDSVTVTN
jgi:hypothetical protein